MNFVKVEEGNVSIVHHSTASLVEIKLIDDDGDIQMIWLDYYDWDRLLKAIERTK